MKYQSKSFDDFSGVEDLLIPAHLCKMFNKIAYAYSVNYVDEEVIQEAENELFNMLCDAYRLGAEHKEV